MRKHKIKRTPSDIVMDTIAYTVVTIFALLCIFPFIHIISLSFSSNEAAQAGYVTIYPIGFNTHAYRTVLKDSILMGQFFFTGWLTLLQIALSLFFTTLMAYPLSRPRTEFKWKKVVSILILITMYFSGGLIPTFILYRSLNLLDTFWVLVLPSAISTYNMFVMRSFFQNIPNELIESVMIDGGNHFIALTRIVLPLSKAVLATMALFYGVARWNGYSDVIYYITNDHWKTLQLILYNRVRNAVVNDNDVLDPSMRPTSETLKAASIVFTTIPILILYPWLQKYFVKGVTLGAVKG